MIVTDLPSTPPPNTLSRRQRWLLTLALALILWLPRGLALDHFVAVDERSWLTRSGNFYLALSTADLASTYQSYHPGVTTMWLGMLGYLWQYPDYPADATATGTGQIVSMTEGIEDTLVAHGHSPMTILAAGRTFMVLAIVALLLVAFWLAVDLFGWLPALTGIILLGFEPLGLGLTRMLHVDGLSSALMLVSVLALLRFYVPNLAIAGRWRDVILSGIMAGLGWLTKSPALVLGPMVLLIVGFDLLRRWRGQRDLSAATLGHAARVLALWGGMAMLVFVLFWPSMWVRPIANIQAIFSAAEEYAEESNQKIFFNGEIILDDPGALFYPVTYAWHVTPITLIGLGLALIAGVINLRLRRDTWQSAGILLLYALLFTALMTFGSKKIDRYLLPAYLPLALVAGVGWSFSARLLGSMTGSALLGRWLLPLVLAGHAALILPHFPYYFTFYNPLLGGNDRASQVLMIGLGEGLDEAARHLNTKPNVEQLRVASWYRGGSFNFIFRGQDLSLERFFEADYAVIYVHQWQRQVPDARMMNYFAELTPEYTVKLHGLEYAWVYDLRDVPTASYFTDWASAIRLTETELPRSSILPGLLPGDSFLVNLHLHTIGTMDSNLNAVVRLMDAEGNEVARSGGWPFGSPTSTWQPGDVYIDGHEFTIPADQAPGYLRVELSFYDGDDQQVVTPVMAGTTTPRGDFVGVGYVAVGLAGKQPALLKTPPLLGDQIKLVGARLQGVDLGDNGDIPRVEAMLEPGLPLLLAWQPTRPPDTNYVTLVHLIAPDGTLAAQYDGAPLQGVVSTTMWREGDILLDAYHLDLPPDLPPGEYRLLVGLYDLPTLTRLPVQIDQVPVGDTIQVATVVVP